MNSVIPEHLKSTYELIVATFPEEVSVEEYLPLLYLLYADMSERNVAEIVSKVANVIKLPQKDYYVILNDLWFIRSEKDNYATEIEMVKQKLLNNGYAEWLEMD